MTEVFSWRKGFTKIYKRNSSSSLLPSIFRFLLKNDFLLNFWLTLSCSFCGVERERYLIPDKSDLQSFFDENVFSRKVLVKSIHT